MATEHWWDPDHHAARRDGLLCRNRIRAGIFGWFTAERFAEVETSALQVSPGNELHLHAFRTSLWDGDRQTPMYLRTSPELAAKKLLAAGEPNIFEFAGSFRNREQSRLNAPEFTMLEWYRVDASLDRVMLDTVAIVRLAALFGGAKALAYGDLAADPFAEPERLSVAEAFSHLAGIDLLATLKHDGTPRATALKAAAVEAGIRCAETDSWSDVFSRVMAERIEPTLGLGRITLLTDYPAPEAALARIRSDDPRIAERFELFAAGVELANGFGELTDADQQRQRFNAAMEEKERLYGERYPIDEDFLSALSSMPPAAGVALGFDRLVMLVTGATSVASVQWTPMAPPNA